MVIYETAMMRLTIECPETLLLQICLGRYIKEHRTEFKIGTALPYFIRL